MSQVRKLNSTVIFAAAAGFSAIGVYILSLVMYGNRKQQKQEPDIIYGDAFYGCSKHIDENMHKYLQYCKESKGDIFTLRMKNGEYTTFIMDNIMFKKVYFNKSSDFNTISKKSKLRFGLDEIIKLENGIDLLSDALHKGIANHYNLSKLTKSSHIISKKILKQFADNKIRNPDNKFNNEWKFESKTINKWITNLTMKILLNVFFGSSFANDKELIDLYFQFEEYMPLRLNGKQKIIMDNIMNKLINKVETMYSTTETTYTNTNVPPILRMVNDFCHTHNLNKQTRNRLIVLLLWGALSNTSHTMSWICYHILKDKKCKQEILNELDTININDTEFVCSKKQIELRKLLPNLYSLVTEIFRYYGQSNVVRYLVKDITITDSNCGKKYKLRKNDWIVGCCSFLHKNKKYFKNPNEFKFDRFLGNKKSNSKNLFTFGSRCVGRHFAESLIIILCGLLFKNFEFKVIDKSGEELNNNFVVPPIGFIGAFGIPRPQIDKHSDLNFKWRSRNAI